MIYLILGPFGLFILFRVFLPVEWCIDFLIVNDIEHKYYEIVSLHLAYLLLEGFLLVNLMIYIVNRVRKYRKFRNTQYYINTKNKEGTKYAIIGVFGILIFLVFNYDTLPIFMEGGSDAIVALGEMYKTKTWFWYGILGLFTTIILVSIIYIQSNKKKYLYGFILLLTFLVGGKKSGLISFLNKFVFVYFLMNTNKLSLPVIKIGIGLILSSIFILIQFSRTSGIDIDISQALSILFNLIYSSSTSYLAQIINQDGLSFAQMYSNNLGDGGSVIYILNPFMKFIFDIGIYKALGPFLGEVLYGYTFPNGVNPTLFFEPIFVFGTAFAILFSFINLFLIFFLAKYFIKKVILNSNTNILLTVSYFSLFFLCFSFLNDTLNTVRNIPFALLPMLLYYCKKFLKQSLRKKYV